jgi:hypothetical protein
MGVGDASGFLVNANERGGGLPKASCRIGDYVREGGLRVFSGCQRNEYSNPLIKPQLADSPDAFKSSRRVVTASLTMR